jgi:hypothetical protein
MSEWLEPAPRPQATVELRDLPGLAAGVETPLGEFLAASMAEGFWATGAGQAQAQARRLDAARAAEAAGEAALSQDEWRTGPAFREGLTFREGITLRQAQVEAEIHDEVRARRALIAGRNAGAGDMALGFGAGVLGSLPTPENFIPFAGPALRAAEAGRFGLRMAEIARSAQAMRQGGIGARAGVGAAMGATDATLGSLAVMPLVVPSRESFGDDVTFADILLDLVMAAGAGTALGGGAGALLGRQATPPAQAPDAPPGAPESVPATTPPAVAPEQVLRGLAAGADQIARGEGINLALLPPDVRASIETMQAELQRARVALGPGAARPEDGKAAMVAGRTIIGAGDAVPGGTGAATTPTGQSVPVRYEVRELADLVTSNRPADFAPDPRFPQDLQPRDRSQREYQDQVAKIASELRPEELAASPQAGSGAPIVRPDGVVLSGNGRTLAIARAYAEGLPTAEAYRAFLARQGFDVATMQQPVLVRVADQMDPAAERRFTRDANSDVVAQKTTAEVARTDAERLTADTLALIRGPDLTTAANAAFIRAFTDALPQAERTALSRDGALTPDGLARINRALAARAYGDAEAIALLMERTDSQVDTIGRALMDAAPAVARLRGAIEAGRISPDLDPSGAIVAAVRRINDARQGALPLADMLDHADLLGGGPTAAERAWLDLMLRRPDSDRLGGLPRDDVAGRVVDFVQRAQDAPTAPDLLGNPPPGFAEVMRQTLADAGLPARPDLAQATGGPAAPAPRESAADWFTPQDDAPPPLPDPHAGAGDEGARRAAAEGFDMDPGAELEARRLAEAGTLPEDIRLALEEADAMAGKVEKAEETWAAAAACAIRG